MMKKVVIMPFMMILMAVQIALSCIAGLTVIPCRLISMLCFVSGGLCWFFGVADRTLLLQTGGWGLLFAILPYLLMGLSKCINKRISLH